jgi:hypothetical protein
MSFDNQYFKRKDWRKLYFQTKARDKSCRPHGGCTYCLENRLHSYRKRKFRTIQELNELEDKIFIVTSNQPDANEYLDQKEKQDFIKSLENIIEKNIHK